MGDRSPKDKNKKKKQDEARHHQHEKQKVIPINQHKNGPPPVAPEQNTGTDKVYKKAG